MCILFCFEFPAVLVIMLGSTIPISIVGSKFAMSVTPFWAPAQFSKIDVLAGFITFHLKLTRHSSPYSWHALLPMHVRNSGYC